MCLLRVLVMVAVCCKVEADWHEDEIMGLNLFEMNEKRFNLTYCGPRADTGRRYFKIFEPDAHML